MGKWFGQAAEIEELRAQNHRLKTQVESLEARLRVAYAQAGIAALAGDHAAQPSGVGADGVLPGVVAPAPGLNDDERALASSGRKIKALKAYKDRTGVDLKQAKAAVDAAL